MGLLEDYGRYVVHRNELDLVSSAIKQAVEPFNPGDIFVAVEHLLDSTTLHIGCKNWPSLDQRIDISRLDMIRYPEDSYLAIMRLVAEAFKNIEYISPESNIILGED